MTKLNYNYGKVENGKLIYAPNKLITEVDDKQVQIFNAPMEQYAAQGWLPIVKTEQPTAEDGYYTPVYIETDGKIMQEWEFLPFEEVLE